MVPMMGSEFVQQVAATVRAEAGRRGLTQGELAQEIGMNKVTMSTKWRGVSPWRLDELPRLAVLFGLPSVYVMLRTSNDRSSFDVDL